MSKGLFITATGTDIGKTYVTALLVKKLRKAGYCAGYYKAALSGAEKTEAGLLAGDADYVNRTAELNSSANALVSYVYEHAVSPHLAAMLEGNPVEMQKIKKDYERISSKYDFITMEGSGGIVCPIRWDKQKILLEDIIKELKLPVLIVADAGLGTINSVVLTVYYIKNKKIPIKGIILNHFRPGDVMEEDNVKMIEEITGIKVLAKVKDNDTEIEINEELLAELYE